MSDSTAIKVHATNINGYIKQAVVCVLRFEIKFA